MHHKGTPGVNVCSSKSRRVTLTGCVYFVLCQILEVKSPTKQSKQDKNKNLDCDKVHKAFFILFSSMKQPI